MAEGTTSLLATKLFVPQPRPGLVARPRLVKQLEPAFSTPLTLVSAPAGFGKTTVLAQWIASYQPPRPVAWVSLDEGDNDPVRFWSYFIAAVRTVRPDAGESASGMLRSPQPYPIEAVLTALINDVSSVSGHIVLVLDDYHVIQPEPVGTGMAFLTEHLPSALHLVIATRTDPPLPLPRFRGRGMILDIRADDLRFTTDETGGLLAQELGEHVSARHVASLSERTEGWAAGLKMAALSLRGRQDVETFLASFAGNQRYVMDYLVEEALKQQRPEVREVLLTTSVLEKLSAPLCDAVTGRGDSGDILLKLESSFGGFLIPLDDSRQWYRYHHLFGDLLRHQLQVTRGTDEVNYRHRLASAWFEDNNLPGDAIRHALAAGDWHRVMALIDVQYEATVKRGEWDTLFGWFQSIPDEVLRTDLRLCSHYVNVLITHGSVQTAKSVLAYLESVPNMDDSLRGELAFFRMSMAYREGDLKRMSEIGETAVEQLAEDNGAMRARALHMLAVLDWGGGRLNRAQSRETEVVQVSAARRRVVGWRNCRRLLEPHFVAAGQVEPGAGDRRPGGRDGRAVTGGRVATLHDRYR